MLCKVTYCAWLEDIIKLKWWHHFNRQSQARITSHFSPVWSYSAHVWCVNPTTIWWNATTVGMVTLEACRTTEIIPSITEQSVTVEVTLYYYSIVSCIIVFCSTKSEWSVMTLNVIYFTWASGLVRQPNYATVFIYQWTSPDPIFRQGRGARAKIWCLGTRLALLSHSPMAWMNEWMKF